MTTISTMLDAARRLSRQDRIQLMQALLDDMAREPAPSDLTEDQKAELRRRRDAHRADPSKAIPRETVSTQMRERHRP